MSAAADAALDAARELVADDLAGGAVEAPAEGEQPEAVADEAEPQETDSTFDIDPELPDDVKALVDEPDFEEEAEVELSAEEPDDDDDYEYDEEKRELKKQLKIAQKKAEHFEKLRLQADRSKWEAEAEKFFPFADPQAIQADSRRAFLRQAKAQHEQIKTAVQPVIDKFQADRETIRAELEAEIRAEVTAAWGRPTVNPNPVPAEAKDKTDKVDALIQSRGLAAGIREMLNPQ